jgi:hypothetical protein
MDFHFFFFKKKKSIGSIPHSISTLPRSPSTAPAWFHSPLDFYPSSAAGRDAAPVPLLPVTAQHPPHRAFAAVLPASMGSCCGGLLDHLPELQPPATSATSCCRSPPLCTFTRFRSPDHPIPPPPAQPPPPPPGFDAPSTRNAGVIDRCSWPSAAARAGRARGRPPRRGGHGGYIPGRSSTAGSTASASTSPAGHQVSSSFSATAPSEG